MKHQRSHLYSCLHPCHCRSLTRSPVQLWWLWWAGSDYVNTDPLSTGQGKLGPAPRHPAAHLYTGMVPAGRQCDGWWYVIAWHPTLDIYLLACLSGAVSGCMGRDASHLINKRRIEFEIESEFILTFWISNLYINTSDNWDLKVHDDNVKLMWMYLTIFDIF